MSDLISRLHWRYAAKRMNGNIVPAAKLGTILEAINLAPTSVGLQPFNILVIEDRETREKMHQAANSQPQILEASHVLVFAAWETVTADNIDHYINLIASTRGIPVESLALFQNKIKESLLSRSQEELFNWSARQAYIALGYGLIAAATEQVDATPMEGFDAALLDEVLNLKEKGLKSVVMVALGYRDEEKDPLASAKKVRRPHEELFITV
ncbi:NAD(P)H-dependent oxidoreductase [Dyadobacter sandarakinus]|uniref:NAD(P)H-dependent oxidoreductase n=1 Tax=Dyadobacter sandarakinus TaxID=2747268 RepID=A0ABX7ICE8_9BACT|nr:NAD(P)H-dependent oxidoreductase [Dyadobacter sandarakinus]QRR03781.1 NAD(P)H-dependent oxidoreductase [Dyadobacter sandarakinus]